MTKRFELTLVWTEDNQVKQIDKVQDDNLISLLAQFIFIIVNVHDKICEDIKRKMRLEYMDDDIPF